MNFSTFSETKIILPSSARMKKNPSMDYKALLDLNDGGFYLEILPPSEEDRPQ